MSFNGSEGEAITLEEGSSWTKNWREGKESGDPNAVFFGREKLQAILAQSECVGIRIYFAIDDDGQKTLVLVGANADENDQTNGMILDRGLSCPPYCPTGGGLNG